MSTHYYYLVGSLPLLHFRTKLPISTEQFLKDCEQLLSPKNYSDVQSALSEISSPHAVSNPLLQQWVEFNRRLRNEIAWFRAIELNKDPLNYIRGDRYVEPYLVDVVIEASRAPDPLEAEKIIDRARWRKLNELEQGHYFDLEFLIVYGLKLKILQRYQAIESPAGAEIFRRYIEMELPAYEHD